MQHLFCSLWLRWNADTKENNCYSETIVQFPITCLFCILLKKIYIKGQWPRWHLSFFVLVENLLLEKPFLLVLGACFSLRAFLCPVFFTIRNEAAADGGFSVWRSAVHLPPCPKQIIIWAVLVVYERQRRRTRMDSQTWRKVLLKKSILEMRFISRMTVSRLNRCW